MNRNLAKILNSMAAVDQKMRKSAIETGAWDKNIDRLNTAKLKRIIKKYGWPTISLVGRKASKNAWLIAQHADHDIRFQKKILNLLRTIYRKQPREINVQNIAYLSDRVLVNQGKKQLFGTQFFKDKNGKFHPRPIRNIRTLEKRRKQYNLPSLAEYKKLFKKGANKE